MRTLLPALVSTGRPAAIHQFLNRYKSVVIDHRDTTSVAVGATFQTPFDMYVAERRVLGDDKARVVAELILDVLDRDPCRLGLMSTNDERNLHDLILTGCRPRPFGDVERDDAMRSEGHGADGA